MNSKNSPRGEFGFTPQSRKARRLFDGCPTGAPKGPLLICWFSKSRWIGRRFELGTLAVWGWRVTGGGAQLAAAPAAPPVEVWGTTYAYIGWEGGRGVGLQLGVVGWLVLWHLYLTDRLGLGEGASLP